MISITKNIIRQYFDDFTYYKGDQYFKSSKVSNVILTGDILTANVDGSNNNKYSVRISLNQYGNIINTSCTCPVKTKCKHTVAALLFFSHFGPQKYFNIEKKNPLLEIDNSKQETKLIKFQKLNPNLKIVNMLYSVKENQAQPNKPIDRYKAVIILDYENINYYYNENPKWHLTAGIQSIKKNGIFGKTEKYKAHKKITEPVDENITDLFEQLVESRDLNIKIDKYIDFLIRKKIPFYSLKKPVDKHFEYTEIIKMKIIFSPASISSDLKEIYFKVNLEAYLNETNYFVFQSDIPIIISKEYFSFIIPEEDKLLYFSKKDLPNQHFKIIKDLLARDLIISITDIQLLKDFINKSGLKNIIEVDFNKTGIKLKNIIPKPVLELEEYNESIKLSLLFEYENMIVRFNKNKYSFVLQKDEDQDEHIEVYKRDNELENQIFEYINTKLEKISDRTFFSYQNECSEVMLKSNLKDFLIKYGIIFLEEGYELKLKSANEKIKKSSGKIKINVKTEIDWFDVNATINDGQNDIPLNFNLDDLKNGLIKINNQYIILSKDDIAKLEKFTQAGMNSNGILKLNKLHFNTIDLLYSELEHKDFNLKKTVEIIEQIKNFKKIKNQKKPVNFKGVLRDYQHEGYNWLNFLYEYNLNGCLADDMGLGKTVQTLCFLQKLKNEKKLDKVLLIVPVSTIPNWESEINRFTPDIKSIRHIGGDRVKEIDNFKETDIIITSYHTFRNDIEFFKEINLTYVILDEAQNIKNSSSQTFKAVKLIDAQHKLSLTGTPVENNSLELWSQMDFLHHDILGSVQKFKNDYAVQIEKYGNAKSSEKLRQIIKPFILRRKKEDVAKDLPDKEEIIYYCEMEEKQKIFYNSIKNIYYNKVAKEIDEKGIEKSAMTFFEGLLRLRQAALYPGLIDNKNDNLPSCKNEALMDIIDEIVNENHKSLIFSQFVETLKRIEKQIIDRSYLYSYIDGSTKKRDKEIKDFQEDDKVKLFLLSLKAGGVGINLTKAEYVILFDPWWNPAVESQAIDRAHRIGQKNKVIVYKLIVKETVEEKILLLQEKKKKLVSDLISEEPAFFKSLTKEDILELFK